MEKYKDNLSTMQDMDDMDELIWGNACRFNINEFCHQGGFTPNALQEFIDLAKDGFLHREKEK